MQDRDGPKASDLGPGMVENAIIVALVLVVVVAIVILLGPLLFQQVSHLFARS